MTTAVDVAVVGSGPVGSAFARTLVERRPTTRVVMLERGPAASDRPGRHLKNIADPAERDAAHRRMQGHDRRAFVDRTFLDRAAADPSDRDALARPGLTLLDQDLDGATGCGMPAAATSTGVGGMGVLWTASCPRPEGAERIGFVPWAELEPCFDRADRLLGVQPSAERDPTWTAIRAVLGSEFDRPGTARRPVRPLPLAVTTPAPDTQVWSAPDMILEPLLDDADGRFRLRSETLCRRLTPGDDGCRLEVLDRRTDTTETLVARHVYVAADAFRTPQLLWASGIRPPALGRHLNDHLQVLAAAQVDPALLGDEDVPFGGCWVPYDDDEHPFHGQVLSLGALPATAAADERVARRLRNVVGLSWFGPKEIQAADAVRFSDDELDADGMPRIEIRYDLTDHDRSSVEGMKAAVARAARAIGALAHAEPVFMPGGSSLHYQGTTRMGPRDDGTSVCDPHGRVWGTEDVWVGGNGVIPTPTACNPTITSVALAVRTADRVATLLDGGGGGR